MSCLLLCAGFLTSAINVSKTSQHWSPDLTCRGLYRRLRTNVNRPQPGSSGRLRRGAQIVRNQETTAVKVFGPPTIRLTRVQGEDASERHPATAPRLRLGLTNKRRRPVAWNLPNRPCFPIVSETGADCECLLRVVLAVAPCRRRELCEYRSSVGGRSRRRNPASEW